MSLTIALDLMGGDDAPAVVIDGAALAHKRHADVDFLLFGDEAKVRPHLAKYPALAAMPLIHTTEFVAGDAKPSHALRQGRQSSMRLAINAVKEGRAAAAVSAGNTGALMAMAKFVLKTLPGIDRPAIAGPMPAGDKSAIVLDLGANVDCGVEHLVQFAVMGHVFARIVLGLPEPKIGLLNIGTEDLKGNEVIRGAAAMLRASPLNRDFYGFVEGTDVTRGVVDVVVTDGFTGNVALKLIESTSQRTIEAIREVADQSARGRLGRLLLRRPLHELRVDIDPEVTGGAYLLGLRRLGIVAHGRFTRQGFAQAMLLAARGVRGDVVGRTRDALAESGLRRRAPAASAEASSVQPS